MWVNKQDLDAVAAEQRRAMKAILDDMKRTGERLAGCGKISITHSRNV